MKYLLIAILLISQAFASLEQINSFEADFSQSITDDKNKVLVYNGHVIASKPQNAKWSYYKPVKKDVYINKFEVVVVEPEIEQVIVRRVESKLDFFKMISKAKEIEKNVYSANFKDSKFTIVQSNNAIESISYIDEFENRVKIVFKNIKQNHNIDLKIFTPIFPLYYDIIRD
ncbi:MAG: LolA-like outer membrane lipoprotein chaperone [Sulfurimonas sp.]|nr:LolA-like outer membrane lipoprotein chaperone [Sulfurimonas sp.]